MVLVLQALLQDHLHRSHLLVLVRQHSLEVQVALADPEDQRYPWTQTDRWDQAVQLDLDLLVVPQLLGDRRGQMFPELLLFRRLHWFLGSLMVPGRLEDLEDQRYPALPAVLRALLVLESLPYL